ncbi:hypothetical protein B5M09_011795 [Aphanomyces astaci]|uniref:HTH CENPB-type domain-containing protein n=2 Tax=Aphanomyces astaci TaxID=112090 RepID=A0A3R7YHT7_APHAT|nr:hypothetical protein B5M09_011795 [Aphanomyces astaci]
MPRARRPATTSLVLVRAVKGGSPHDSTSPHFHSQIPVVYASNRPRLTLGQKAQIPAHHVAIDNYTFTATCAWVVREFGSLCICQVSRIVRDGRNHDMANIDNAAANIRRNIKAPQQPEIDSQLAAWVVNANDKGASITGQVIKRKGQLLERELNLDGSIRFSNGWLHRFQQHNTFKMYRMHGEAASANSAVVQDGRTAL